MIKILKKYLNNLILILIKELKQLIVVIIWINNSKSNLL